METKNKKIIAIIGIFVLLFILGYWLFPKENGQTEYIFDKSYNISLEDVKKSRKSLPKNSLPDHKTSENTSFEFGSASDNIDQKESGLDLKKIFAQGLINSYTTLKYFKHLEHLFRKSSSLGKDFDHVTDENFDQLLEEYFDQVKKYLFSQFSEPEAQKLFDTYKDYLKCEIALSKSKEIRNLTNVRSTEEAIEALKQIQEFRRDRLGVELADKLFGADVKAKEYAFRRADIVGDDALYGPEKEDQLKKLNQDMWGEDADAVEDHPNNYNRYKEKLKIYQKDFDEMPSEQARKEKDKEFRNEFFTPEVVKRLDDVDQQIAAEKQNELDYREKEKQILEDKKLSEEKRSAQIQTLQNKMFGDEADAFKRRETMRIELERLKTEHPVKR